MSIKELLALLGEHYHEGGWMMHGIAATGIIAFAIFCERFYIIWIKSKFSKEEYLVTIKKFLSERNVDGAIAWLQEREHPLANILRAGLVQFKSGDPKFKEAMDLASISNMPQLEKRTGYLAMLGNIATLAGLLGTVVGLIGAFGAVGGAEASKKAEILAASISEAMNCTAFGIGTAIPCLLSFAVVSSKTTAVISDIETVSATVSDFLERIAEKEAA